MTPVKHKANEPEVVKRIVSLLIEKNIEQKRLMEHLGLHRNNFTQWKSGKAKSYMTYIFEIASFLGVTPEYLLCGNEPKDEAEFVQIYRSLDDEKKLEAILMMRKLAK